MKTLVFLTIMGTGTLTTSYSDSQLDIKKVNVLSESTQYAPQAAVTGWVRAGYRWAKAYCPALDDMAAKASLWGMAVKNVNANEVEYILD